MILPYKITLEELSKIEKITNGQSTPAEVVTALCGATGMGPDILPLS